MRNLKITYKLLIGFGTLLAMLIGLSYFAISKMSDLFGMSKAAIDVIPAQNAIVEIQYHTTKGHLWFEEMLSGDNSVHMEEIYNHWNGGIEYASVLLDGGTRDNQTYSAVKDTALIEILTSIRYALVDMVNAADERLELKKQKIKSDAGTESDIYFDAAYQRVMDYCDNGKKITTGLINKSVRNLENDFSSSRWTLIIETTVIVLIGILFSTLIARTIALPVREAALKINRDGVNTRFDMQRKDEIGQLVQTVDSFLSSFRMILREVADATAAVSSSSKQIGVSTENMARNAQDQMGQTASVTAAIEEMSKTSYEIAHNIGNTKEMAIHAQSSADKGSQVIDETVDGMQKMLAMVQQSSNVVNSLSESSRKITKVVSIIDDITKQVNLIALNASIEATRAGEKGKGFAVVADEIKKLAERTAHSTTEINDIISKIQVNVNEAVNLMGRSNEEAANGIRLSQEAKSSLKEISDVFKNVTMMVSQVAVSSQEQSVTGDQITDNVKVINTATQQIAGGINEIAKSAEYLNNLTTTLQKTVKRFKIGD